MLVSIWITNVVADNASKGYCNWMQYNIFQYFSIICSQQMAWYVKHMISNILFDLLRDLVLGMKFI